MSITVESINDAPVLTPSSPSLTATTEDVTSSIFVVGEFTKNSIADVDINSVSGIVITAKTGEGTWQYSLNSGSSWSNFPELIPPPIGFRVHLNTLMPRNSLLLRSSDLIRYIPDQKNGETATFTFRAWDQTGSTSGQQGPTVDDVSLRGDTYSYSTASDVAYLIVTPVNDAPVLTPQNALVTHLEITEDAPLLFRAGSVLEYYVAGGRIGGCTYNVADVDIDALTGVAICGMVGNGTWEYSDENQINWIPFPTDISASKALLLCETDYVRYNPDYKNGETISITYRAWDQSNGTPGTQADSTVNGVNTAFSINTDTSTTVLQSMNDAPVITPAKQQLATITEDVTSDSFIVGEFTKDHIADVDINSVSGIAIEELKGHGTWQYSINNGSSWNAIPELNRPTFRLHTMARINTVFLLRPEDRVRYIPDQENAEKAGIAFFAWDQTGNTAGLYGTITNVTETGDIYPYSRDIDYAIVRVTPVNDAPVLTSQNATIITNETEDNRFSIPVSNLLKYYVAGSNIEDATEKVSDVDILAVTGVAINGLVGNGTWEYSVDSGLSWAPATNVSLASSLLLRDTDSLRYNPDQKNGESISIAYSAWDQSWGTAGSQVDATGRGETTAFSASVDTTSLVLQDVNDAPVITQNCKIVQYQSGATFT